MAAETLYLYGLLVNVSAADWHMEGIDGNAVFAITEGALAALVHNHKLEENLHLPRGAAEVKRQVTLHNEVLCKAMGDFGTVIPLKFGTLIVGKDRRSPSDNLRGWMKENRELLEKTWGIVKGKREYGIRIYCQRKRLESESGKDDELDAIRSDIRQRGAGLAYLLGKKLEIRAAELLLAKINHYTDYFYGRLEGVTRHIVVNKSRLAINGEEDLLLNVSVLVDGEESGLVTECLGMCAEKGFSYRIAGPFPPYSFVEQGQLVK